MVVYTLLLPTEVLKGGAIKESSLEFSATHN